MSNLNKLKSTLESLCKIISWNPTAFQLKTIANKLVSTRPTSIDDVEAIIASVCPDATFICLEGIDNSDVRALLALAIQVANTKS